VSPATHGRARSLWNRGRRLLLACAMAWIGALGAAPALAATVRIVTSAPVAPGKFVGLAREAAAIGLTIEAHYVEKLADAPGPAYWDGADLVLIDAPRPHLVEFVRGKLGSALPALEGRPHVWLAAAAPRAGGGLDPAFAQRLHAYYVNGGHANAHVLVQALAAYLSGADWRTLTPPQVFPSAAVYHPGWADTVFPGAAEFLAWKGATPASRPPVVAIAFHQQSLASEQMALVDTLVQRIEAAGALAMPVYAPVMDKLALPRLLSVDGVLVADALINTQITLNPEGRREELQAMGIPVVQAMAYRHGDAQQWREDAHGIHRNDVPFYLAQAEYAGITDIQITAANRKSDEQLEAIREQVDAMAQKAVRLVRLQRKASADKQVAIFFWNYPAGEKNLSASFMNVPRSLWATLAALQQAGYRTETRDEASLVATLQRLLEPPYRPPQDRAVLRTLLRDDLAARLPLARYRAWLQTLPPAVQAALLERWGDPARSTMLLSDGGEPFFVVPRLQIGNVTLLPQPNRSERGEDREKAIYHSTTEVPAHHYLATYLWAREELGADALVHFGTHGTQEWMPGKERGLSVYDWPMLAVGDVPVVYPYIVDNIGEATQAKRRGRATIISHQTPPLVPAGLHETLTAIHDLLHQWLAQDEGGVKTQLRAQFLAAVKRERIHLDMGWDDARIERDFGGFVTAAHDHLHELALTAQPLGLHTFGRGSEEHWRVATVLMMLGKTFWEGVKDPSDPAEEADELLIADHARLASTKPYRLLSAHLQDGTDIPHLDTPTRERLAQARRWYEDLGAAGELRALLAGLEGRYIPTSYGGDPIKNPDALPTGRNLYGFDPSRVPTRAAWEAGKLALDQLLAGHREKSGRVPRKITFTLWSVETMRHFGLLEAQALWALGVEPQWDAGGRVVGVKLIPRAQLGRPRVDVVLSVTGLYRDHFPNVMKQLADAALLAARAGDEADNPVAANAERIARNLIAGGVPEKAARAAGATRIFASESGRYGTGLDDAALATDTWKSQAEGDRKMAELYLSRMQFAYGPDEADWGRAGVAGASNLNLYAEHLRGTEAAVLARSSNLYGMLTTDDPFQYLGGIGLAVRHLDGKAPELYISNLRGGGAGRVEGAAAFLAKELATRNFHPGYIQGLMAEGYAGTLQVLDGINNFAGWQSVAREIVRHDQWQEFMDVYVRDKHELGLKRWFEANNPHALAQGIERMLEAARQGQWKADAASVAELKARWRELSAQYDVRSSNQAFKTYVAPGFGLQQAAPTRAPAPAPAPAPAKAAAQAAPPEPAPVPPIQGLKLERVLPTQAPARDVILALAALLALALAASGGAWRGWRESIPSPLRRPPSNVAAAAT